MNARPFPAIAPAPQSRPAAAVIAAVRADAPLYLAIASYTIAGLLLLSTLGAADQAAYAIYVARWATLFLILMPAVAVLVDGALVIHRFDRRRGLALRRTFSAERVAALLAGMALLMAMVLFQGTFTSIKNVLPLMHGGFPQDGIQADIDRWLHFGTDPWRWLYSFAATDLVRMAVEWNYNVAWFALVYGALFFVATSPAARAVRMRYIFMFMLVWVVCGNLLAGVFLSAGPAFYGFVTGDGARFAEQLAFLQRGLDQEHSAAAYQQYLWSLHADGLSGFGSGISAFPSVHVGLAAMNAFFVSERWPRLALAAWGYVALIVASSVYLAWHYAIDGYVSIAVVALMHFTLRRLLGPARWRRSRAVTA
ncbi:MAG: phosphatase PAP2 family protein [Rhizobiaceae bacterium]|nr:phosphatase PAP2 family protein [Rhizobiaceae bacterium]